MKEAKVDLLEKLIRGNVIALIGSGPSSAMGYPSWEELARKTYEIAKKSGYRIDEESFYRHIEKKEFAKAFSCLQDTISREKMLHIIRQCLVPSTECGSDEIYKILTRWPFICYLTTNFDDEIQAHLRGNNKNNFHTFLNGCDDFRIFRSDMKDYIFKIHGSLENSESAIVTEEDYHALRHESKWLHYQEGLKCIFRMFDVIIIGHSLSDPDVKDIIESVKEFTSPTNPIYMFMSNVTSSDIRRYRTQNNIQIFKYNANGKDHSQLARLLKTYDSFILPVGQSVLRQTNDSLKAAALYAFRMLSQAKETIDLENFLLMNIPSKTQPGLKIDEIRNSINIPNLAINYNHCMLSLQEKDLIELNNELYNRTKSGDELVAKCQTSVRTIEKLAIDSTIDSLSQMVPSVDKNEYAKLIKDTIFSVFEKRGLIIAQKMFSETITSGEVIDIFEEIAHVASNIANIEIRIAFIQVMRDFILYPSNHQKQFLTSIAQGLFIFYMLGNNSDHADFRKKIFENTYWFVDSNMLLPLLAKGCFNHDFAVDLFVKLRDKKAQLIVTNRILQEVCEHLYWAIKNCETHKDLFANATLVSGNKQNLFIDGFIHQKNRMSSRNFTDYCDGIKKKLAYGAKEFLRDFNISVKNLDLSDKANMKRFSVEKANLKILRYESSSYRGELQVETEAELLILMSEMKKKNIFVYFLSQSNIFSKTDYKIKTFSGEATYRYLLSLPDSSCSQHLHECLLNELYASGINFIDKDSYNRFFNEDIELAKLNYESEKQKYIDLLETADSIAELDKAFNATPDLEKPLFVNQMSTKIADLSAEKYIRSQEESRKKNEIIASKDAEIARLNKELEKLKNDNMRAERRKQVEEATERNLRDPKHVAKRKRQQKARTRKK